MTRHPGGGPALRDRRKLGWTDLEVAPLALGTMQFGWSMSDVEAMDLLDAYVAAGGNLIDTADMYGPDQNRRSFRDAAPHVGVSEDLIGRWMRWRGNRDQLVVATKVRARMWDGPDGDGLSRAHIERALDESLRRLRTDHIDLYQAHWPDDTVAFSEAHETLARLVDAGKVRYIGTSNYAALGRLAEALEPAAGLAPIASEQPRYSLVNRSEYEEQTLPLVQRYGIGVLCYSPLAAGFLTGKYRRDAAPPDGERARFVRQYCTEAGWALVDELDRVSARHDVSPAAVALAWLLAQPGVTAPVVGANSIVQLEGWLPAATLRLEADELTRLGALGWAASNPEFTSW